MSRWRFEEGCLQSSNTDRELGKHVFFDASHSVGPADYAVTLIRVMRSNFFTGHLAAEMNLDVLRRLILAVVFFIRILEFNVKLSVIAEVEHYFGR